MNSLGWLETCWQDIRFALRMFVKSPGATAAAVISLAIAIGPNCALFSVVNRLMLKPPQIQGITKMFFLWIRTDRSNQVKGLSCPDLLDYRSQAGDIGSFVAYDRRGAVFTNSASQREGVRMNPVTENYFSVLGVRAAAGRVLEESDAHFEGQPPAVISYSLWLRQFDGATDAVGKTLFLNGRAFTVVGIMPRGFRGPGLDVLPADVWIPFSAESPDDQRELMRRERTGLYTLVRLRDNVDQARAEAVLTTVAKRLASQYPETNKGKAVLLENPEGKGGLGAIILSLAGLVMLIACANIAGILVAQGEARRQEFAVRVAMGASRSRLVRQLIAESLLLSLLAAAVGLLLALWLIRGIPTLQPLTFLTVNFDFRVDSWVLAYTLLLALLTALAAGLVPSLRASRPDLVPTLKGDAPRVGRRFRFRGALVIAQVATSQFLLIGTGLLVRSYLEVQRIRLGFDPIPFVFAVAPLGKGGEGTLLIETAGPPTALAGTIRRVIHDAEPDALVLSLTSLRQHMQPSLFPYRIGAGLVGAIAILGMFLAAVGLYGLVSYSVGRRRREIGVRMAMGAGRADVLTLVLREALQRVLLGAVIGLAVALAVARLFAAVLYRVSPADPIGLTAAVSAVALVGLLAAYVPARRALRVNPMDALREQ